MLNCLNEKHAGVVYFLHNGDFQPRYIGQTTQLPRIRLSSHRSDAKRYTTSVYNWMNKHGADTIQMVVIETFDSDTVHLIDEREMFHIAQERMYGDNLNLTDGGGGHRGHKHSEETKSLIREARSKQVFTEETRLKMSKAHMGNTQRRGVAHSAETRAKMSATHKARQSTSPRGPSGPRGPSAKQQTPEYRAMRSKLSRLNAHNQWHVNRDIIKPDCTLCTVEP